MMQKFRLVGVSAPTSIPNAKIEQCLRELKAYEVITWPKVKGQRQYIVILPEKDFNFGLRAARSNRCFSSVKMEDKGLKTFHPTEHWLDTIHSSGDDNIRLFGEHANELVVMARNDHSEADVKNAIARLNLKVRQKVVSTDPPDFDTGPKTLYVITCSAGTLLDTFLRVKNDRILNVFGPSCLTPHDSFRAGDPSPGKIDW